MFVGPGTVIMTPSTIHCESFPWALKISTLHPRLPGGYHRHVHLLLQCHRRGIAQLYQLQSGWSDRWQTFHIWLCIPTHRQCHKLVFVKAKDSGPEQHRGRVHGHGRCCEPSSVVKTLQGLGMLSVSVALWMQGFSDSVVQWFRGECSSSKETEVERKQWDCKR